MADTIARLIFEANTAQLKKANDELKKLAKESGKAAKSIQEEGKAQKKTTEEVVKGSSATKNNTKTQKDNTKETKKATSANEKLAKSFRNAATATATLQGPLNGVSGRLSFIATGLARIGPAGLVASAGMAALAFATKSAIDAFAKFESEVLQLEQMLETTGHRVGLTSEELQDLAIDVGMATLAAAGDIRKAEGILLTFGSITGEQFKATTVLAQDLAQVMGVTASSAAKTLGKAIEDPVNNLASLSRAGVVFNDTERDIIDTLLLANDKLGAQDFIIKKLESSIGGAGAAAGTGLAGAFDGLTEQVDLLRIAFAQETGIADFFESKVKSLTAFAKSLTDALTAAEKTDDVVDSGRKSGSQRRRIKAGGQGGSPEENLQNLADAVFPEGSTKSRRQLRTGAAPVGKPTDDSDLMVIDVKPAEKASSIIIGKTKAQREAEIELGKTRVALFDQQKVRADHETTLFTQAAELRKQTLEAEAQLEMEKAQQGLDRETTLGQQKHELAIQQRDLKFETIKEGYEKELEMELQHKAALGDIDAQAALDRLKFDKLTEREKTKQRIGLLKRNMQVLGQHSKAAFRIAQLAAVGETVMQTQENMIKARDMYAGTPFAGVAMAIEAAVGAASIANIKAQSPRGNGSVSGGGGGGAAGAAAAAPIQPAANDEVVAAPQAINVTVDGSIDPTGARRIIEAINEATEDGLEINALVGT